VWYIRMETLDGILHEWYGKKIQWNRVLQKNTAPQENTTVALDEHGSLLERCQFCRSYLFIGHKTYLVSFLYTSINNSKIHNYTSVCIIIAEIM
jgi:hypothetical protein